MDEKLSRRDALQRGAAIGVISAFGAIGCGKEKRAALSCTDTGGLAPDALALRTSPAVAYVDRATEPGKSCAQCQQFVPAPSADVCGTCKVLKGPINPNGSCKLFVVKPAS
jgi:hypothetical protein